MLTISDQVIINGYHGDVIDIYKYTELAESTWYLYRATGNPFYLEVGKAMIDSIENISRVECGYATV